VEVGVPPVAPPRPSARRRPRLRHEPPQRVVLGDARAQRVEARVGEDQPERRRRRGRGVAGEHVQEVLGPADVHRQRRRAAVRVAVAARGGGRRRRGAAVEHEGVRHGERRPGADVARVARDGGVVEADDEVVRVDLSAPAGAQEDAAVPDDGAGVEAPDKAEVAGDVAHDGGDVVGASTAVLVRAQEGAERGAEAGEEGAVGRERVVWDAEAEHGAGGGVREAAEVEEEVAVVVMARGGGYRGVGQHRGGVGNNLVAADVDGR